MDSFPEYKDLCNQIKPGEDVLSEAISFKKVANAISVAWKISGSAGFVQPKLKYFVKTCLIDLIFLWVV